MFMAFIMATVLILANTAKADLVSDYEKLKRETLNLAVTTLELHMGLTSPDQGIIAAVQTVKAMVDVSVSAFIELNDAFSDLLRVHVNSYQSTLQSFFNSMITVTKLAAQDMAAGIPSEQRAAALGKMRISHIQDIDVVVKDMKAFRDNSSLIIQSWFLLDSNRKKTLNTMIENLTRLKSNMQDFYYVYMTARQKEATDNPLGYQLTGARYPSGTLVLGKSFGLRGEITANYPITSLEAKVIRTSDNAVVLRKTIYPNAKSASLYGAINDAIVFNALSAGNYVYIVSMDVESLSRQVELIRSFFSVASAENPVVVTGYGTDKSSLALGEEVRLDMSTQFGVGQVQYRFVVHHEGQAIFDTGYTDQSTHTYKPAALGTFVVDAYARDNVTEDKLEGWQFEVNAPLVLVAHIALNAENIHMTKGSQQEVFASVFPLDAANRQLEWKSSNDAVMTVSRQGQVTALSNGEVTITATALDGSGISANLELVVWTPVAEVAFDAARISLAPGASQKLVVRVLPEDATNRKLVWFCDDTGVATVSQEGDVTAVGYGSTVIHAAAQDGTGAHAAINVAVEGLSDLSGDADGNHVVNQDDLVALIAYLVQGTLPAAIGNANINADEVLDIDDLIAILQIVLNQ